MSGEGRAVCCGRYILFMGIEEAGNVPSQAGQYRLEATLGHILKNFDQGTNVLNLGDTRSPWSYSWQ